MTSVPPSPVTSTIAFVIVSPAATLPDGEIVIWRDVVRLLPHVSPWITLVAAGVFEIGFTTFMKLSNGFQVWRYNVVFAVCALLSFGLLNLSTRALSLGTAYAVWTGIGAFGTAAVGILVFRDPATAWRVLFLATLIGSIIGLRLVS
jgi:quaternary ammonium compound-resistance protein SugE